MARSTAGRWGLAISGGRDADPPAALEPRTADRSPGTLRVRRLAPGCALDAWPPGPRRRGSQSLAGLRPYLPHRPVSPAEDGPHRGGPMDPGGPSPESPGGAWPERGRPRLWGCAGLSPPAVRALGITAYGRYPRGEAMPRLKRRAPAARSARTPWHTRACVRQ